MKYAAKKIAAMLLTMVIVSLLAFTAFSLISGDAAEIMLGTQVTPERLAALRGKAVRFTNVTEKDDMAAAVKAFLQ